jgi:hypothetical protein
MAHANARLPPAGRLTLVRRISAQPGGPHRPQDGHLSDTTAYRCWDRYRQLGAAGVGDRPSVPTHSPRRTAVQVEQRILRLRRRERLGPGQDRCSARYGDLDGPPGPDASCLQPARPLGLANWPACDDHSDAPSPGLGCQAHRALGGDEPVPAHTAARRPWMATRWRPRPQTERLPRLP